MGEYTTAAACARYTFASLQRGSGRESYAKNLIVFDPYYCLLLGMRFRFYLSTRDEENTMLYAGLRLFQQVNLTFRYSVTAITPRSHRGDPGSTPGIGVYNLFFELYSLFFFIKSRLRYSRHDIRTVVNLRNFSAFNGTK